MAVRLKFTVPPKRKAGQRAGMSRSVITQSALVLIRQSGTQGFKVRKLAAQLKVSPTTVHSHFKMGESEIFTAVARSAFETLAPPYLPSQTPQSYLEGVM